MPNPNYRPDQPEYYDSSAKLDTMNNIIGGNHALKSEEEVENAFANAENYRAYAISRLPQKASSQEIIDTALEKAPSLRIKTRQQKGRRELSEKARQAIVEAAVRKVMGQNGRKLNNRLDAVFSSAAQIAKPEKKMTHWSRESRAHRKSVDACWRSG